jgi:hypothetical protein
MNEWTLLTFGSLALIAFVAVVVDLRRPSDKRRIYWDSHTENLPKVQTAPLVGIAILLLLVAIYCFHRYFFEEPTWPFLKYGILALLCITMIAGLFSTKHKRK